MKRIPSIHITEEELAEIKKIILHFALIDNELYKFDDLKRYLNNVSFSNICEVIK